MRDAAPALRRAAARGDDAPLLPDPRARGRSRERDRRRRAVLLTAATSTRAARRHLAAALRRPRRPAGGAARARRATPRTLPDGEPVARRPLRARAGRRRATSSPRAARGARRRRAAAARRSASSSRVARPSAAAACRPSTCSRSARGRDGGWSRTSVLRGLHPMMAERLDLWRLSNFALERLPSAEDVYLFRGVARENPKDERLFALAEVRDLTPVRDEQRPRRRAARARAHARARRSRRMRALPGPPRAARAAAVEPRAALRLAGDRPRARGGRRGDRAAARRMTAGLGLEMVLVRGRLREPDGDDARPRAALLRARRRAASSSRSTTRPTRPLQPLDEGAQRIVAGPPPRHRAPGRDRQGCSRPQRADRPRRSRAASSSSTTSTTTAASCPVDRPPATNDAGHRRRPDPQPSPSATPRACCAWSLLGDPTRALGSLAEPECRRIIAALDLAERARRAGRVVRAVGRREDRDGLAAPRTWTGSPRRCAGSSSFTQARRRDQRRRHRHQRRRPAVLERRGDDAHAHARASS